MGLTWDKSNLAQSYYELGIEKGLQKGIKEGIKEGVIKTAAQSADERYEHRKCDGTDRLNERRSAKDLERNQELK